MVLKRIEFEESELDQIIDLIRNNLDPNFTKAFFKEKHLDNPLGRSSGIIAEDQGKIIGVTIFMFWEFYNKKENKTLTAIRPADTAVHKNYRGQGLFKKMTWKALAEFEGKYEFMWCNPNENSLIGFTKMGWIPVKAGNLNLGVVNPFFGHRKSKIKEISIDELFGFELPIPEDKWHTHKTTEYLKWRYNNPMNYKTVSNGKAAFILSVDTFYGFKRPIILESFGSENEVGLLLKNVCRKYKTFIVYFYNNDLPGESLMKIFHRKKAVVSWKDNKIIQNGDLQLSLGDLEGRM